MEYQRDGVPPDVGRWRRTAEAFPGPFAVAVARGLVDEVGVDSANGLPWAITVREVDAQKRRLFCVRTVRSSAGLPPGVWASEELPSLIGQFPWVGGSDVAVTEQDMEAGFAFERRLAVLPPTPVALLVDGVPVPGRRLALDGLAGIELPDWHGQRVFVVGQEPAVDAMALRTGSVAEDLRLTFRTRH